MKPYNLAQLANEIMSGKTLNEADTKSYSPNNDYEGEMAITQLKAMIEKAQAVLSMLKPEAKLEAWVQSKITLADDYMSSVSDYLKHTDGAIGESVVSEGVRMMAGAEKMVKDDPAGGSSMVSSLRNIKKSLEGKPTGSVMVVTKEKSPESMSIKVYEPSDFASFTKGFSKKPEAKVGSKGSWSGGEVTVIAIKESVEVAEDFRAGDKVKVPHKGKMVSGKIVRFDDGGTSKAQQHGGGYVVDVGEPASILVPKQKVQKEEVTEAFNPADHGFRIDPQGGKFVLYKLSMNQGSIRFADGRKGTVINTYNSKEEAIAGAKRNAGVKEEVEVTEAPMIAPPDTTLRGYSPTQFENKFRELLSRLGFSKALPIKKFGTSFWVSFENMPKARDFSMTLENLMRRNMKSGVKLTKVLSLEAGDEAIAKGIVPSSTRAVVVVNLGNVMQEAFESYGFVAEDFYKNAKEEV